MQCLNYFSNLSFLCQFDFLHGAVIWFSVLYVIVTSFFFFPSCFFALVYPVFSLNLWKHRLVSQYDLSNFLSHEVDATSDDLYVPPPPFPPSFCPSHLRYSDALCHRFCICVFWIWARIFLWFFCFCLFGVVCVLYVNVFNSPDNVRWFPSYWPACGMCTMTASEQHFEIYMYKSLCKDWLIILSYHSYKQLLLFLPMRDSGLARLLFLFSVGWMCWILRAVVMPRPVRESCLDLSWNHAWNHT